MAEGPRRRGSFLLLAATLASLILTVVAGYVTRLSLIEASQWVTHTDEVKLAIADCARALDHDDTGAFRTAMEEIQRLTVDNARQLENTARAPLLMAQGSRGAVDALLASMQHEEDRLMAERIQRVASAQAWSRAAFLVGALLTMAFGASTFALLRAQRQDIARQGALLEAILESVDEGIIAVEASLATIAMNAVARSMVGRAFPRDHIPEDWRAHISAIHEDGTVMAPMDGPLARAVRGETVENVVYRIVPTNDPSGEPGVWVSTTARPIRDESGRVIAAVATLRDITEQRATAERLRDLSSTDELTGLLNRRGFLAHAKGRIASASRTKAPLAIVFGDVNGLKRINDELGHEQGDRAIQDAAAVLGRVFRDGDVLARIGGDEFVALLPNFAPAARDALLERLAAAIRSHAGGNARPYRLSMSAGLTFMDWEREQTLDELLAAADHAMYTRKRERAGQSMPVPRAVPEPSGTRRT